MTKVVRIDSAIYTAFEEHIQYDYSEPEKNLMRAILRTAIEDFERKDNGYANAIRFFTSRDDQYVYSFRNICNHLNLCAETILRVTGISAINERKLAA